MNDVYSKCRICKNFCDGKCNFCDFVCDESLLFLDDDGFDIFGLCDGDDFPLHLQLLYRLNYKGVDCLFVDVWFDLNVAYVMGVGGDKGRVARVLGLHDEVVYDAGNGLLILNLFQEKFIRGLL